MQCWTTIGQRASSLVCGHASCWEDCKPCYCQLQGADLKDVMQQLLPVEEDKGKPEQAVGKAESSQQIKAGNAKEAKPGTPAQKRDQGSKGAFNSRSADKRHQERRPQDSSRSHQVATSILQYQNSRAAVLVLPFQLPYTYSMACNPRQGVIVVITAQCVTRSVYQGLITFRLHR